MLRELLRFKNYPDGDRMVIWARRCPMCAMENTFTTTQESYDRWRAGALIQDVWPDLAIEERETRISGICSGCFDKIGGSE